MRECLTVAARTSQEWARLPANEAGSLEKLVLKCSGERTSDPTRLEAEELRVMIDAMRADVDASNGEVPK